jgi:hypothetical protein
MVVPARLHSKKLTEQQRQLDDSYLDAQDSADGQRALPAAALQPF